MNALEGAAMLKNNEESPVGTGSFLILAVFFVKGVKMKPNRLALPV